MELLLEGGLQDGFLEEDARLVVDGLTRLGVGEGAVEEVSVGDLVQWNVRLPQTLDVFHPVRGVSPDIDCDFGLLLELPQKGVRQVYRRSCLQELLGDRNLEMERFVELGAILYFSGLLLDAAPLDLDPHRGVSLRLDRLNHVQLRDLNHEVAQGLLDDLEVA